MKKLLVAFVSIILAFSSIQSLADISVGSKGQEVVRIQQALIDLGYLNDKADGVFGNKTAAAVSAFQRDNNLPETGAVDDATQEAINKSIANSNNTDSDSGDTFELPIAPDESFIINGLSTIPEISIIAAATEDNDPISRLNKQGGYTSQIFFSSPLADPEADKMTPTQVLDIGTICGGSIEVYSSIENAQRRDTYLSSFDGTPFGFSSHTVIGSCIIRISHNMTASQQKDLENKIINVLSQSDTSNNSNSESNVSSNDASQSSANSSNLEADSQEPEDEDMENDSEAENVVGRYQSGDFNYSLLKDGTVMIDSNSIPSGDEMILPDKIDGHVVSTIGGIVNSNVKRIIIPDTVKKIMSNAFRSCSNLTYVNIPDSVEYIGINPFCACRELTKIDISPDHPSFAMINGVLFSKKDKRLICYPAYLTNEEYTIPQGIEIIGSYAFVTFLKPNNLKEITIPDTVTTIGESSFRYCSSLESLIIPSSVTTIGNYAFSCCFSLSQINIPDNAKVGVNPFVNCSNLMEIDISSSHPTLQYVDNMLYDKSTNTLVSFIDGGNQAPSFSIPIGTINIGNNAFEGSKISEIDFPNSITSIGEYAFCNCAQLSSITIPGGVTNVETGTFEGCSNLESVVISGGIETIGYRAFGGCYMLSDISIPSSVISIDDGAFENCELMAANVEPDSFALDYCIENGIVYNIQAQSDTLLNELTSGGYKYVMLADGTAEITCYVGTDKQIDIPSEIDNFVVSSIGQNAFYCCDCLNTVAIPDCVTSIGNNAFSMCANLDSISIPSSVTIIGDHVFDQCSAFLTVLVEHDSAAEAYCKDHDIWYSYPDSYDWLNN